MVSFKQTLHLIIAFLRPKISTCIIEAHIQSVITFIDNAKTILIRLMLRVINTSLLQFCFSVTRSTSIGNNTKLKLNAKIPSLLLRKNLKLFFNKVLKNLPHLKQASGLKLSEIYNINRRNSKIELFIYSTFNLFQCN